MLKVTYNFTDEELAKIRQDQNLVKAKGFVEDFNKEIDIVYLKEANETYKEQIISRNAFISDIRKSSQCPSGESLLHHIHTLVETVDQQQCIINQICEHTNCPEGRSLVQHVKQIPFPPYHIQNFLFCKKRK